VYDIGSIDKKSMSAGPAANKGGLPRRSSATARLAAPTLARTRAETLAEPARHRLSNTSTVSKSRRNPSDLLGRQNRRYEPWRDRRNAVFTGLNLSYF
jgi:hypothetical protein